MKLRLVLAVVVLAACGGSAPLSPAEQLKQDAAQQFENIDSRYFDDSHAAVEAGKKTGGEAGYVETMNGLADANHAFFQGLKAITFPSEDQADVRALLDVTVKIETETLLEVKAVGSTSLVSDLDARNAADRSLRKDLGLDPAEIPS